MMLNKYVAIDLGSSKITALAAEVQADNTLKILAVESKPSDDVKHGIIEQLSGAAYKISELTRLIQNSARIHDIDQVSVSVGAKSMRSTSVTISRFVGESKTVSDQLIYEMNEECIKKENPTRYGKPDITSKCPNLSKEIVPESSKEETNCSYCL